MLVSRAVRREQQWWQQQGSHNRMGSMAHKWLYLLSWRIPACQFTQSFVYWVGTAFSYYRQQLLLRKGNVFTSICYSVHRGACMPKGGVHGKGSMHGKGGHVWQGGHSWQRGHAWQRGHVWQGAHMGGHVWWGACMAGTWMAGVVYGRGHAWRGGQAWQERWPLQWTICILLECILV